MKLQVTKIGSGPSIIILHGFLGTSDNWISIGRALSEFRTVYLVDQRNHGRSFHSEEFNYDLLADDLYQLIQEERIENPVLIGHSMGGKVVMNYSLRYPDSFDKLIIVDISPRYYPVHHQKILAGLLAIPMTSITTRNEADDILSEYVDQPSIRQFLLKNLDRTSEGYKWKANLKVLNHLIEEVGKEIYKESVTEKQVYFIRGDQSDYIRPTDREQIKSMYPMSKILTIKNAGHWLHAEQQDSFFRTLLAIL